MIQVSQAPSSDSNKLVIEEKKPGHPDLENRLEGFPLHQLRLSTHLSGLQGTWNFQGNEVEFNSKTDTGFGLMYRFFPSATFSTDLLYESTPLQIESESTGLWTLPGSEVQAESLFLRLSFSWIGMKSFFYRYGWSAQFGQDSYPTLDFVNSNTLEFTTTKDLVAGLSMHAQWLFLQPLSYRFRAGANWGTQSGDYSGPTAKANQSYFAELGLNYMIDEKSFVDTDLHYRYRNSTQNGALNGTSADWETESRQTLLQLSYSRTF